MTQQPLDDYFIVVLETVAKQQNFIIEAQEMILDRQDSILARISNLEKK